jgi:hypothetical protein
MFNTITATSITPCFPAFSCDCKLHIDGKGEKAFDPRGVDHFIPEFRKIDSSIPTMEEMTLSILTFCRSINVFFFS